MARSSPRRMGCCDAGGRSRQEGRGSAARRGREGKCAASSFELALARRGTFEHLTDCLYPFTSRPRPRLHTKSSVFYRLWNHHRRRPSLRLGHNPPLPSQKNGHAQPPARHCCIGCGPPRTLPPVTSTLQMSVCNLFLKQQITVLPPSSYPSALALPDRSSSPQAFDIAISAAGVGLRSACAIPRMASVGGYPGSAGNVANIVCCSIAVILGVYLALMAGRRQAAVARWEVRAFFIVFALQYLFQLLSTGE